MTTAELQGEQEKAKAEELIAANGSFDGIDHVTVELGEDYSGDAAMWVVFHIKPEFEPDDSWFRAYNDYSTKLSLALLHSGLSRFPYTRLKPAA